MSYKNPKFIMEKTPNYVNGVAVCLSCGTELTMHKRIGGYCRDCYFRIWGKRDSELPGSAERTHNTWKLWYDANSERVKSHRRQYGRQEKLRFIAAYGGKCECCGETNPEFLSLDHINGGGQVDRAVRGTGEYLYRAVRREGYPTDKYRLLCLNCNFSYGHYGYCPHRKNEIWEASGTSIVSVMTTEELVLMDEMRREQD